MEIDLKKPKGVSTDVFGKIKVKVDATVTDELEVSIQKRT